MFSVSGVGLSKIRHMQNGGKRPRRSLDQWDRVGISMTNCVNQLNPANCSIAKYDARFTNARDNFELS